MTPSDQSSIAVALAYLRRWRDEPDHDEQFVMDAIAVLDVAAPDEERRP